MNSKLRLTIVAAFFAGASFACPAQAQWSLEGSLFQNNSYYRGWVNPYDNTMTRMQMPMMRPNMMPMTGSYRDSVPPSVYGERVIKRGRATNRFAMRPFPIKQYMSGAWSGGGDADLRKRYYAEWLAQSALWRQQTKSRGAQFGDYAQMHALAFVMCVEAYGGKRISNAGYQYKAARDRDLYLKSAAFQGYTPTRKQELYEKDMLSASYALFLRQSGDTNRAREVAGKWLDESWDTDHPGVSDAEDAATFLARFAVGNVSPKPRVAAAPSNQISLAQAQTITLFSPVAPSLLPSMLAAKGNPNEREQARRTVSTLLDAGRGKMRQLFQVPAGKQSVADAMTYAVITFYTASKTTSGNLSEAGFTQKNLAGLNQQLTLMLARNPEFRAQNAKQKQEMFETFVLMATFVGAMNGQAEQSGDAGMRDRTRALAGQSLQKLIGVPIEKVRLTKTGMAF